MKTFIIAKIQPEQYQRQIVKQEGKNFFYYIWWTVGILLIIPISIFIIVVINYNTPISNNISSITANSPTNEKRIQSSTLLDNLSNNENTSDLKDINSIAKSLSGKLIFPIENIRLPDRTDLYPGAPRIYRGGLHESIDFYVPYGTPVRAVMSGYITYRSPADYRELASDFRENLLKVCKKLKKGTFKDIYFLLLGKFILVDHGVIDGHRILTRYAHLSSISPDLNIGDYVKQGDVIGYVGNSGTKAAAEGRNFDSTHLDFAILVDHSYLGEGLSSSEAKELMKKVFNSSPTSVVSYSKNLKNEG